MEGARCESVTFDSTQLTSDFAGVVDLWSITNPRNRDHTWNSFPGSAGRRRSRTETSRQWRSIAVAATAVFACFCCALWSAKNDESSHHSLAESLLSMSGSELQSAKTDIAAHPRGSRPLHTEVGTPENDPAVAAHDPDDSVRNDRPANLINREYEEIIGQMSTQPAAGGAGNRRAALNVRKSQPAVHGSQNAPHTSVLDSAHTAVLALQHQLTDSDARTSNAEKLSDAKSSIRSLEFELKTLGHKSTSQVRSLPDVVKMVADAVSGETPGDREIRSNYPETTQTSLRNTFSNLFGGRHHGRNLTATANLTAGEQQIADLALSARKINSKLSTSQTTTTAARDAVGVLKAEPSPGSPLRSIVIKIHHPSHKGTTADSSAETQAEKALLPSRLVDGNGMRKIQLSHLPPKEHKDGQDGGTTGSGNMCGCCHSSDHCSCCEQGWFGLQTFGKWLLMVLALVLCVMTFLIFGFICFGCLWAWREFRRQDRWERFLDRTASNDGKDDARKQTAPEGSEPAAKGASPGPPTTAPSNSQAGNRTGQSGSAAGRPISRRADSQLAR